MTPYLIFASVGIGTPVASCTSRSLASVICLTAAITSSEVFMRMHSTGFGICAQPQTVASFWNSVGMDDADETPAKH